jgi:hypothetical protein
VFELFKVAEAEAGKYYTQQKKQAEARSKAQTRR